MRYLASVVTNCFGAFGELLGMQVRTACLLNHQSRSKSMHSRRPALHMNICMLSQ